MIIGRCIDSHGANRILHRGKIYKLLVDVDPGFWRVPGLHFEGTNIGANSCWLKERFKILEYPLMEILYNVG